MEVRPTITLSRSELRRRVQVALRELEDCCACPRNCHVNRLADETRVCRIGRCARVVSAFPHTGEEDCLRGWNGSGTIFFGSCNLHCVFCQNDDISDIYMPDFKFWTREMAKRLARAADYPERARDAIREMHRQVGPLRFGPHGLARRGVLVRHLVMPDQLNESAEIFHWLADLSPDTYVNIMGQYRPEYLVGSRGRDGHTQYPEINRTVTSAEMRRAYAAAHAAGLWRFDSGRLKARE